MRRLALCLLFSLSACHSLERITGSEKKKDDPQPHAFYVVACCEDNDGHNNLSWPSFLPQTQIDLCIRARNACHSSDCQMNGDTYLPTHVDCGHGFGFIGDKYYPTHGY